jgi:hypothetical protein
MRCVEQKEVTGLSLASENAQEKAAIRLELMTASNEHEHSLARENVGQPNLN